MQPRAKSARRAATYDTTVTSFAPVCAVVALAGLFATGCDSFFVVRGQVTDCTSGAPLPAVSVDVDVERGYDDRVESFPDMTMTDAKGNYQIGLNDPSESWATLTFHRQGYLSLTPPQFKGHTDRDPPANVCLNQVATP
jgi:hypothetical protein